MENCKIDLITPKRQQSISRLQWVEPEISSPPGNATLPKAEPFLAVMGSFLGKNPASCGDSNNQDIHIRSKLSTGERK